MTSFTFAFSPVQPQRKDLEQKEENILLLTPFSPQVKLLFEDIKVGSTCTKIVKIQNPVDNAIKIKISKPLPIERGVTLNWEEAVINAGDEITLELAWHPTEAGTWRDVFRLEDGRRLKKDISVTFKSINPKTKVKKTRSNSPLKLRKPSTAKKPSTKTTGLARSPFRQNVPAIVVTDDRRSTFVVRAKENIPQRNQFNDSLEMPQSPHTSLGMGIEARLESLQFTPLGDSLHSFHCSTTHKLNTSSETYVKGNLSSNTYTMEKTPTKDYEGAFINVSGCTYVKEDCNIANLADFTIDVARDRMENTFTKHRLSPLNESTLSCYSTRKRKSDTTYTLSPPKRSSYSKSDFKRNAFNWYKSYPQKEALSPVEPLANPYTLAEINNIDPFMMMDCDSEWLGQQELRFKKVLNVLLAPPDEFTIEDQEIDIAKLWQLSQKKEIRSPPTEIEKQNRKCLAGDLLNNLRKKGKNFIKQPEIDKVIRTICQLVDDKKMEIRNGRQIHLDIGLQKTVMSLFLSYNPIWLRIGLETVYQKKIVLHSNSDTLGLSRFIFNNVFKNSALLTKYKSVHTEKYSAEISKSIIKSFLTLVYFLDKAKISKLIPHNPCLFVRNAEYKSSLSVLLKFSSEAITVCGYIAKYLSYFDYKLSYDQHPLDEYDFSIKNLGGDLRDGVRITKLVEIAILNDNHLLHQLRLPAPNLSRKKYNMEIAFNALTQAGFEIQCDITPEDIVIGHREKTLSFLWQVIYKYQGPRIKQAASTIQAWWRSSEIIFKRRILNRRFARRNAAATKIQRCYRHFCFMRNLARCLRILKYKANKIRQQNAAIKIQSYFKMFIAKRRFNKLKLAVIKMESIFLRSKHRAAFLRLQAATIVIQRQFRANSLMKAQRFEYLQLKTATILIQNQYRANKVMKIERTRYLLLLHSSIFIQRRFKANRLMKMERDKYNQLKHATILLQRHFKAKQLMIAASTRFLQLKQATITIQNHYRAQKMMQANRANYLKLKASTVAIQRYIRTRNTRRGFLELKQATKCIQERFRAHRAMKEHSKNYLVLKQSTVLIQQRFRANKLMKKERTEYLLLLNSAKLIQQKYRAYKNMRTARDHYVQLVNATITIQQRFKANKLMEQQRNYYCQLLTSTRYIQARFRANKLMREKRRAYQKLKDATLIIQKRFWAHKVMRIQRNHYLELLNAVKCIQVQFRAYRSMKTDRNNYLQLQTSVKIIQQRFRAYKSMQEARTSFLQLRSACICVQRRYIAKKLMMKQHGNFVNMQRAAIVFQRRFRAQKLMKEKKNEYMQLVKATTLIQARFKATRLMQEKRNHYQHLRKSTITIQQHYIAYKLMKIERYNYFRLQATVKFVQSRFRANIAMLQQRNNYQKLLAATKCIQQRFRAQRLMKQARDNYRQLVNATITIQQQFRANRLMKLECIRYLQLQAATKFIQRRWRANVAMKQQHNYYLRILTAVRFVQNRWRANTLMENTRNYYRRLVNATVFTQQRFRAIQKMKHERARYMRLRQVVICVQNRFRSNKLARTARNEFITQKNAAIVLQQHYRANKLMKIDRESYLQLQEKVLYIQKQFRRNILLKKDRSNYLKLRKSIIYLQRLYKANKIMRSERKKYLEIITKHRSAIKIQAYIRGFLARKLSSTKLMNIKQRCEQLKKNVCPKDVLCNRLRECLKVLRKYECYHRSVVLYQLKFLLLYVNNMKGKSEPLAKELSPLLFTLLKCTSRSLYDNEVCKISAQILIIFCKYKITAKYVLLKDELCDIFAMMPRWCDKESEVFPYLCTFVWLMLHDRACWEAARATPSLNESMAKIIDLIVRKSNMVAKHNNNRHSVFINHDDDMLPTLLPNWGFDTHKRPISFKKSLFAILQIAYQLKIYEFDNA